MKNLLEVKELLEAELIKRDCEGEINYDKPDPFLIASRYEDAYIALICALFAYGNAKSIVKFLDSLDFSLLDKSEEIITHELKNKYYRFQTSQDVIAIFIAIKRMREKYSLEELFYEGYKKEHNVLDGLWLFLSKLQSIYDYSSSGYKFLIGSIPKNIKKAGTYKRYMMFLRWVVRKSHTDLGIWNKIDKKDLLMPLDTHTFGLAKTLGLIERKSYDMLAVKELTNQFKRFDENDPIKYDFALYRLGQEKIILK